MPKSAAPEESSFASDPDETPASPDDLARSVQVEIRGKTVNVSYDLSEMTPRLRKRLSALEDADNAEDAIVEYIETIVTGWDLTDKRGTAVSLSDVDAVSYRDLAAVATAINKALVPNA